MEERQVTIGDESFALPAPFFVLATQNPIEHEGTYPLPEAQLDRFLLKLVVGYPSAEEEHVIAVRDDADVSHVAAVADAALVASMQRSAAAVHVADAATQCDSCGNPPIRLDPCGAAVRRRKIMSCDVNLAVTVGASPRQSLPAGGEGARAARRARSQRRFDVKRSAPDVLRHRIVLSYEAEADGVRPERVVDAVLAAVETP
jgi:MoxR-like ATPase